MKLQAATVRTPRVKTLALALLAACSIGLCSAPSLALTCLERI